MPTLNLNGIKLHYKRTGSGEPMVLVHGSWVEHDTWATVMPLLSESFDVVSFDRRGHGQSGAGAGQGSFAEDADDLGALLEALGIAPAHVVGNSGGASIALRLAAKRPELFRGLAVHEPPLLGLLAGQPEFEPMLAGFGQRIQAVLEPLQAGDHQTAARTFVESIAMGPGAWDTLPDPVRETFIRNAPTFLDESNDPGGLAIDLDSLRAFTKPTLITIGTESAPFFKPIAETVARALPNGKLQTFVGAGHQPHLSHPGLYAETVRQFCQPAPRADAG